jgi:hypothetical protein
MRALRNAIKRHFKRAFELGQRLGIDLLPRHFYSSIPDFRELRRDDRWRRPYAMVGVGGAELEGQIEFLRSLMTQRSREMLRGGDVYGRACAANGESGYGPADGDVLFAFVVEKRPVKIVQVGCGVSTAIILDAAAQAGYAPAIICIEPYPTTMLRELGSAGRVRLIAERAQDVAVEQLISLDAGDLLFVDSSHTTCPNSDVNRIILDALPRLPGGVFVHFHDIAFPYDFGPNILGPNDLFFGAESLLLHAYLIHNPHCRIALSMSMLHHGPSGVLSELLVNYPAISTARGLNGPDSYGRSPSAAYLLTVATRHTTVGVEADAMIDARPSVVTAITR